MGVQATTQVGASESERPFVCSALLEPSELERRSDEASDAARSGAGGRLEPYYNAEGVTLYCGNNLEILPHIRADLCLTDPPYGVAKAAWDNYLPLDWMQEAARYCSVIGVMPGVWNMLKLPPRVGRLDYRWTLAAHLVNGMTNGAIGYGNWIPCLVWATEEAKLHQQASDIKDIVVGKEAKPDHPSPKPLDAMRWFVSRLPGAVVLDPFAGSGTTLLAAREAGRRAIGIEREEKYCAEIVKRLAQRELFSVGGAEPVGEQLEAFVTEPREGSNDKLTDGRRP